MLYFDETDYGRDFEAVIDAHDVFASIPVGGMNIWFKAYDTSLGEGGDAELFNDGYEFNCYIFLLSCDGSGDYMDILNSPAKTKQDAENLFNDWVDAKLKKGC